MRISLPLRIFAVHLLLMLALGALALALVVREFDNYQNEWERQVRAVPTIELFSPLAGEVARSLLLRVDTGVPETQARNREKMSEALNQILPGLPPIERLLILNADGTVQYVNDPSRSNLFAAEPHLLELPEDGTTVRRTRSLVTGEQAEECFAVMDPESGERLGSVLLHYRPKLAPEEGEEPFKVWAETIAARLLSKPEAEGDSFKTRVSKGLSTLIDKLPIEALIIVDRQRRIQYVNEPRWLEMQYVKGEEKEFFDSPISVKREVTLADGKIGHEVFIPVYEREGGEDARRLGAVMVRFRDDPDLAERMPALTPPTVGFGDSTQTLLIYLTVALVSGIIIAGVTSLPVRRLEKAFSNLRARGFKGGFDVKLPSDLEQTAAAIEELGGRLAAMDEQGSEREALLASLSQSLEDGMIAVDAQGVPLAWNPAALRLLCETINVTGAADEAEAERNHLTAALVRNPELRFGLESVELGAAREIEICASDGTTRPARVTQVPVELRPGMHGYLLLIRDLGTLRQVEEHLLEAGRFAVLAHLGAGLAHEIRNPLHAISINADVVEQYADPESKLYDASAVEDSLRAIKSEAKRLTGLLNNYLGLVRPTGPPGLVDLHAVAQNVIQLVNYYAQQSDVEIVLESEEHVPRVHADAQRVQQAILNLVLNSIQAMPDGGRLRISLEKHARAVKVVLADNGPGLPPEMADHLFDTRVTTKEFGTGLGLPLVRWIVEAHGGSVLYRPAEGGGAVFEILMPLTEVPPVLKNDLSEAGE